LDDPIDLVAIEEEPKTGRGLSIAVVVSMIVHSLLVVWFIRSSRTAPRAAEVPIARYVELIKQNPQQFTEAPGQKLDRKPLQAPPSDANREASMPHPTGDRPTPRPGDGGLYSPPMQSADAAQPRQAMQPRSASPNLAPPTQSSAQAQQQQQQPSPDRLTYREDPAKAAAAAPSGPVDWNTALREVSKVIAPGGARGDGVDAPELGGEKGFAKEGPISFETSWYDWGDYAQSMVSRIRVNWYGNMPQIIKTGMQGFVSIRFTIQRDGRITDVTVLRTSGIPPYDFAAKKAIELSSPLNALPKDFPKPSERVTATFYYNMQVPES
jgi:periplasmic protein TonB